MPSVSVDNLLVLPRVKAPDATKRWRKVYKVSTAPHGVEGAGFEVWRGFFGSTMQRTDPFIFLDQMGPVVYEPKEAKGAPWHPHRGFETVTYLTDGQMVHRDSQGGGGVISEGDTQWMTAGSGILHDELPSEKIIEKGGLSHGVQLWVNLPRSKKWSPPRYQAIEKSDLALLTNEDGSCLIRLIAGELDGHRGAGSTHTPITYAHVTMYPDSQLRLEWNPAYNALAYILEGEGWAGHERAPFRSHQLVDFGDGDAILLQSKKEQSSSTKAVEILLLGGQPIREPVVHYGPFVMNTKEEIVEAIEDYQRGRMGTVPAQWIN
ncbi:hypothetical protein SAMN02745225_01154 [Ferrithrix thermotolerans DSM 19514]|uniref:Pirin n=1 Tax=Ferrithrix thermotolerans DSM 19514 TaxID=1121881 RepID=A0A1M4V0T7_9ACTN|nr:pirin family protein [Ferrithrix thermotolerans]SHE62586.1 hypothetical protein SAMN02745225_01154 [Ferrithrix thermotolerans DSM 19514]